MQWTEARDALSSEQTFDAVRVPDPLLQQYRALAAYPPTVFLFWRRRHDHRTDTRFSARPCQQRPQKCLAVDRIRLGSPPAPRHCDGRWIDNMTFNAVCLKQPVDPKAVQSSFLDHHNLHRTPRQLLSPRPHALQQTEQRATIAARCRILRHPVPFGQQAGEKPRCSTQFQLHRAPDRNCYLRLAQWKHVFFGTQYHPEFTLLVASGLIEMRA